MTPERKRKTCTCPEYRRKHYGDFPERGMLEPARWYRMTRDPNCKAKDHRV